MGDMSISHETGFKSTKAETASARKLAEQRHDQCGTVAKRVECQSVCVYQKTKNGYARISGYLTASVSRRIGIVAKTADIFTSGRFPHALGANRAWYFVIEHTARNLLNKVCNWFCQC